MIVWVFEEPFIAISRAELFVHESCSHLSVSVKL